MKTAPELPLRILTHNIRYATSAPFKGERPWPERKQLLINELLYNSRHQDTFLCLQEVLHNQLVDILSGLNNASTAQTHTTTNNHVPTLNRHLHTEVNKKGKEWDYIGVGRDNGHQAGEYSAIFYRPATWTVQHWETVWLSETPDKPSKSWDAASIRIVTIGVFRHRASGQSVLAMSTHLDDQGSRSRLEAARIILGKIEEYLPSPHSLSSLPSLPSSVGSGAGGYAYGNGNASASVYGNAYGNANANAKINPNANPYLSTFHPLPHPQLSHPSYPPMNMPNMPNTIKLPGTNGRVTHRPTPTPSHQPSHHHHQLQKEREEKKEEYDISAVFLAGDFNSQDFQEAYVELTKSGSPLADAYKLVPAALHYGNTITWTGFGHEGQDPTRIDYVLLGGRGAWSRGGRQSWRVEGYAVLPNKFDDGVFNSDHRAVVVDARVLLSD